MLLALMRSQLKLLDLPVEILKKYPPPPIPTPLRSSGLQVAPCPHDRIPRLPMLHRTRR